MAFVRYGEAEWKSKISPAPRAVALGVFDGLHIGHRAVIAAACGVADNAGGFLRAAVLSITGIPKAATGRLLTPQQEDELLETLGTDEWIELSFSEIQHLSPQEFVGTVLHRQLGARHICCGYNYRFGKGGVGDVDTLKALCEPLGITVAVVPPQTMGGQPISSTRVRCALETGEAEQAARLLGRPFTVAFPVTEGNHRGRQWGIPTINQVFEQGYMVPRFGVYASLVLIEGTQYPAVTNVGVHPTVGGSAAPQVETWISGFSGNLYGKTVPVQLIRFLRGEQHFADVDALRAQIKKDEQEATAALRGAQGERAVLFDFDDTLQDRFAAVLETAEVLMAEHMPYAPAEERTKRARQMAEANNGGYVDYPVFFKSILERWPWEGLDSVEQLSWKFRREFPKHVKLFPETAQVLQELKRRGYRVGIVTNGGAMMQHRKLDLCGVKPLVDVVLVAGEEGIYKPEAEIFLRAAARLCTAPENCVFVGDHPVNDVAGAVGAGMRAIYLNSCRRDEHPQNVLEVSALHEILSYL